MAWHGSCLAMTDGSGSQPLQESMPMQCRWTGSQLPQQTLRRWHFHTQVLHNTSAVSERGHIQDVHIGYQSVSRASAAKHQAAKLIQRQ
jgi:hypothetical protein